MKKVLFLTNIPSPYRVDFFSEFGKLCELTVVFEREGSDERDQSWSEYEFKNFRGYVLNGIKIRCDEAVSIGVLKYIKKDNFDRIIVSNPTNPTGIIAILYMKMRHIPYYIECDGGIPKNGKGIKENVKKLVIRGARGYLSTSDMLDRYYIAYGAPINRIRRYPFTSIYERDIANEIASDTEREKNRHDIGIKEKKVVLFVGQFIYRKGIDILLNASKQFDDDVAVCMVGGKLSKVPGYWAERKYLKHVYTLDYVKHSELSRYYRAADVFVLPAREDIWGLVINDAMAKGIPIVTTKGCIAGTELIRSGENGFIVPVEDEDKLAKYIKDILEDRKRAEAMGKRNLKLMHTYTIEKMADRHMELLFRT